MNSTAQGGSRIGRPAAGWPVGTLRVDAAHRASAAAGSGYGTARPGGFRRRDQPEPVRPLPVGVGGVDALSGHPQSVTRPSIRGLDDVDGALAQTSG